MGRKEENKLKLKTDDDFVPPDGGWGWMIVFAAGFSNLATFPMLQQFGLLFRDKFARQGITSSETTTILNVCMAVMSCVDLFNGPLFRTFSYRKMSLAGAIVIFISVFCTIFSYNFVTYLITFSVLMGAGLGILGAANSLALNTYWKKRRRLATAFSWTTTGLGPIVWPQIITYLFTSFGEEGTILLLSGFSLHAVFCALLLQPVEWHTKKESKKEIDVEKILDPDVNKALLTLEEQKMNGNGVLSRSFSAFSSQYLNNEEEIENPVAVGPNEAFFSQPRPSKGQISIGEVFQTAIPPSRQASTTNLSNHDILISSTKMPQEYNEVAQKSSNIDSQILTQASQKLESYIKDKKDDDSKFLTDSDSENKVLDVIKGDDNDVEKKLTLWEKIYMFFDLDLFKDFTFVNLMLGLTLVTFSEMNWSTLTPFILGDYRMSRQQVAFFMSLLAGIDVCVRFCIPFVANKIGWENSTFYLFGVVTLAIGRIVLAYCQAYEVVILVAVLIGFGKALRTVFMALVLPTHVPLHKLAGASGILQLCSGVVYLALGPVVGYIKDNATTAVVLHSLNIFIWLTTLSWGLEKIIRSRRSKKSSESIS
ncbi:major facilitator superfamily domain-containing protein [Phthorimaea operculella]|nr:major facilitator superfamily domain-containing protein [Phthorimaea operculella]